MQKLIIADDERVIRETIYSLIDWESLGIEVIGLCKDGIEAYNMILDESPDIVMTDIRMPGLSGLELVREISQTDQQLQFIILSGYEEFEYAREAMKYGVKHYLLKPCNETKLIESIREAGEDCRKAKIQIEKQLRQNDMLQIIHQDAMYHFIMEGIATAEKGSEELLSCLEEQMEFYGRYLDFDRTPCYLYYVYFLEQCYLDAFLEKMKQRMKREKGTAVFYGVYVNNTLLLFCYEELQEEILRGCLGRAAAVVEIKKEMYDKIPELLETVLLKVRRYDVIYAIHNFRAVSIWNNQSSLRYIQSISRRLESSDKEEAESCVEELLKIVKEAAGIEFLQMLGNSICVQMAKTGAYSVIEEAGFIRNCNQEKDIEKLRELIVSMILQAKKELCRSGQDYGILVERIMEYVKEHLSDCDLTLKKIAEQHLYMNVDYVSRKFHKITGKKFSQYLTEQRVERAKELLLEEEGNKIQYVAELVGCGKNPQYFSQIFKKIEGMTPGRWLAKVSDKQ